MEIAKFYSLNCEVVRPQEEERYTLCRGHLRVALELVHGTFIDELITVQALG